MKIQTWLKKAHDELKEAGISSARLDSFLILENILGKPRDWVVSHDEDSLSDKDISVLNKDLTRRISREPLAYIIGSKEFYGREFLVNKDVLIPRPESELIIELLGDISASSDVNTVFDIGTGSGCLAISAKLEHQNLHVVASDNSEAALKIARKNARAHDVTIRFVKSDLLKDTPRMPKTRAYIIIANLPYVPKGLITSPEITNEPSAALFSGNEGLDHYTKFWNEVNSLANKPTVIITESLEEQHVQMTNLAAKAGYKHVGSDILVQQFTLR